MVVINPTFCNFRCMRCSVYAIS